MPANMIETFPTVRNPREPAYVETLSERPMAFWDPSTPPAGVSVASIAGSSDTSLCTDLPASIQNLRIGGV